MTCSRGGYLHALHWHHRLHYRVHNIHRHCCDICMSSCSTVWLQQKPTKRRCQSIVHEHGAIIPGNILLYEVSSYYTEYSHSDNIQLIYGSLDARRKHKNHNGYWYQTMKPTFTVNKLIIWYTHVLSLWPSAQFIPCSPIVSKKNQNQKEFLQGTSNL